MPNIFLCDTETTQKKHVWDFGYKVINSRGLCVLEDYIIVAENARYPLFSSNDSIDWNSKNQWKKQQACFKSEHYTKRKRSEINSILSNIAREYKPIFAAHNASFDLRACSISGINVNQFEMYMCTLDHAKRIYSKRKGYKAFCEKHGFMTPTGRHKLTAEVIGRYILNDPEYCEGHTSYDDLFIEHLILKDILRQKKALIIKPM